MKKLTISTELLKSALARLGLVIIKKPVLPALSNVYVRVNPGSVEMITSDLELTISCVCSCEAVESFEMLLPFKMLHDIVNLMPAQPVELQLFPKGKGVLAGNLDIHQFGTLEKVDQFPKIPEVPKKNSIDLDKNLMTWLERAMMSISKDDSRPAMTRALLEIEATGITIVSTDAHTLFRHVFPMELPFKEQILISPKIAESLDGFDKATVTWHAKHVAFQSEGVTVICTRFNDKYPNYRVVIPNHGPNLELVRNDLVAGLKMALLYNKRTVTLFFPETGPGRPFKLRTSREELEEQKADISVEGSYSGKTQQISFGPESLSRMLHQIPFDNIRLHIDTDRRAALITAEEDPDYLGLIMPLTNN